jgi:hypothetical protein
MNLETYETIKVPGGRPVTNFLISAPTLKGSNFDLLKSMTATSLSAMRSATARTSVMGTLRDACVCGR